MEAWGTTVATGGSGASSSAIVVKLNPQVLNEGSQAFAALISYCQGLADDRLTEAGAAGGLPVAVGVLALVPARSLTPSPVLTEGATSRRRDVRDV